MLYVERGPLVPLISYNHYGSQLMIRVKCPSSLAEFVASAPLTPLLKPDNRIRPIAVGTIWRRLVSKVAMKGVGKEMTK
ncbi:hypothetical protein HanRHA438_Chr06g0276291 [Helianthus annuus]|nr:hypothetical protein HanRHA438_Chr06g0276291 [Helianthus annuus]